MAEYLKQAGQTSDEMFPEAGTHNVARMLAGMSLENLIKGIIVEKYPINISSGEISRFLRSHDLIKLTSKILPSDEITRDELELLDELTASIKWIGRYPIPIDSTEVLSGKNINNEILLIDQLYFRFLKLLQSNTKVKED